MCSQRAFRSEAGTQSQLTQWSGSIEGCTRSTLTVIMVPSWTVSMSAVLRTTNEKEKNHIGHCYQEHHERREIEFVGKDENSEADNTVSR